MPFPPMNVGITYAIADTPLQVHEMRSKGFLVMAVEGFESGLKLRRQAQRIEHGALAASLLRHFFTDMLPEVAEHRHFFAGDTVLGFHVL
jgi:hypothetical protein